MNWEILYSDENHVVKRVLLDDLAGTGREAMRPASGWLYVYEVRQGSDHGGFTWTISMSYVPAAAAPPP